MPDPKNSKSPKAPIIKYKGAEKVTYDPTTKGYKKQETIGDKTYFDKESDKAIPSTIPGSVSPGWKDSIIKRLQSGVSPEELVKGNHIDPSQTEEFRQYYKPVYTQPEVVIPKTAETNPFAGLRKGQQIIHGDSDKLMTTVRFADINGQANKSVDRYFDNITGQEIDNNASLRGTTYKPVYTGKSINDYGDESLRSDAQGQTNMLNSINGVPVTKTGDTQILQDANKQGTLGSSTGGGFKHGGLVKKIKKYANGGNINDPQFENLQGDNPAQTALGSTALNAAIPGAGTAYGAVSGAKDMLVGGMSEIDPATGKYVNKGKAQTGGLINGIWNMSGAGMLKTAIDPNKSLGEKALSIGTYGISDLIKNRKNVNSMEANNIAAVENPKKMAEQEAAQQSSLSKQLLDRSQGLANGGKIEGKGTGKSDSITAKIKKDSFVIPSENSGTAETIRKVILKAPITKANLKQGDGEKVKLSNGEHLFTPKEVVKVAEAGIDLNELAPNRELNDDKQKLVHQKELLGFKDGGKIAARKNSTGNKSFDTELDNISKKEYTNVDDIEADIKKLNNLNDKNKSLYGNFDNEIQSHIQKLNKIIPSVKEYVAAKKGNEDMSSEIASTKKFLKENGASDVDIMAYEGKVKGLKKQIFDYKKGDAKKEALNNVLERKAKSSSESDKNELKTKANSFYNQRLIDATKNLELSKQSPQNYTKKQIDKFQEDVDNAKTKILDVNSAANEGGMKLVRERDLYRELSKTKGDNSNNEPTKQNTVKAPTIAKKEAKTTTPNIDYLGGDGSQQNVPSNTTTDTATNSANNNVNDTKTNPVVANNTSTPRIGTGTGSGLRSKVAANKNTEQYEPLAQKNILDNTNANNEVAIGNVNLPQDTEQLSKMPSSTGQGGGADKFNIGNIAESAIPFLQAGYGLSQLRKQGKRPVGELDKDYLKSIDAARNNLDLANQQAKYGFTPEESALLSQENQNLTNMQRYTARNLSGGSAGNAINLERSAINNSFGRGLKAAVENRQLMLQKQGIAGDKQAYLDNLIAMKKNDSRQLFNDKMNAFNQNQQAGSSLVGAGINNIINMKRYQDELAALKNTQGIKNSTYNTLGQ